MKLKVLHVCTRSGDKWRRKWRQVATSTDYSFSASMTSRALLSLIEHIRNGEEELDS